jgi:hypothetical protein
MPTKISVQPSKTVVIVAVAIGYAIKNRPRTALRTPMKMLHPERFLTS